MLTKFDFGERVWQVDHERSSMVYRIKTLAIMKASIENIYLGPKITAGL